MSDFNFIIKNTLIRHYGHKCDGNKNKTLTSNRNDNPVNTCDFFKTSFYLVLGILVILFQRKELSEKLKDNKTKYQQAKQKLLKTKKEVMFLFK